MEGVGLNLKILLKIIEESVAVKNIVLIGGGGKSNVWRQISVSYTHLSKCIIEDGETGICGLHLQDGDRVIVDENDAGLVKANPLVITEDLLNYIKKFDLVHSSCYSYIEEELIKIKNAGIPVLYDFSDEWTDDKLQSICKNINIAFLDVYKRQVLC